MNLEWIDEFMPTPEGIALKGAKEEGITVKEWRMIHGHPVNLGGSGGGSGGSGGKGSSKLTPTARGAAMQKLTTKIGKDTPGAKAALELHDYSRQGKVTPARKAKALQLIDRDIDAAQKLHHTAQARLPQVSDQPSRERRVGAAIPMHEARIGHLQELRGHVESIEHDR